MDDLKALLAVYETHIDAALSFDGRRLTLIQSFLAGVTVVFGFWFNIGDSTRRKALFLPLSLFTIVFSLYASLLIFTHSKSYHEYFFYAEEMIDRYHDVKMKQKDPPKDRKFFARKWDEAREKFWNEKLNNVLVLWIFPILTYSGALLLASFYTNRFDKQRRTKNSTEQ